MLHRVLDLAAAGFDQAVSTAFAGRRERTRADAMGHEGRMEALARIAAIYDRPEHYPLPTPFLPAPASVDIRLTRVRRAGKVEVLDATWTSAFEPHCADVADRFLGHAPNRTAAARLFTRPGERRPAIVLVHGYLGGSFALEERIFPVAWLNERGLDVALFTLPFHAVRSRPGPALFPSSDPRFTNETFRQAILDLRTLVRLLEGRGAPAVGVMGMSLGGYTAALLATIHEGLAFAAPMIPLASLADFARAQGQLVGTPEQQSRQQEALERAHRAVSPLARPPLLPPDRLLILAATGDRITPIDHARRLAAHFGTPVEPFHGGHLLQFGRADAFRALGRMLGRLGLFRPGPSPG